MLEGTELSHEPVLKGRIYCSPFCGGKCTLAAFKIATKSADKLVELLGSEHWKPRVWENLGWHWSAMSKDGWWQIHPIGGYTAFLTLDNKSGHGGTWTESGKTPQEAIKNALASTEKYTKAIQGGAATSVRN